MSQKMLSIKCHHSRVEILLIVVCHIAMMDWNDELQIMLQEELPLGVTYRCLKDSS